MSILGEISRIKGNVNEAIVALKEKGATFTADNSDYLTDAINQIEVGKPIEVSTAKEMDAILANATADDVGTLYLYTGETTDTYENGAIYGVTEE